MSIDLDLERDRRVAARLPLTWAAFFQRFGRLTPTQREAIPTVLDGRDALICAPTASGKTEAACAPLIERLLSGGFGWTILYISPTRALVNDLFERLWLPTQELSLRIERRTGDHRGVTNPPPQILITTPESFDSLLCRGLRGEEHALLHVAAAVLDEIHLLHGSARGEQLRWLLERLRRVRRQAARQGWTASADLQVVALSATLPDPSIVAAAYLSCAETLQVGGGREIEAVAVEAELPALETALPRYLAGLASPEKVLVFCNARRRVDTLATQLRSELEALGYASIAHHGSLSQGHREAAEARMKADRAVVLFATSTLEIGVDIGDVDLVVLDGPAPNVSALLQRIGRGNRRTGKTRVMACAGSLGEAIIHGAMLEMARRGSLGPDESGLQSAVTRQQIVSYIYQAPLRRRGMEALADLVRATSRCLIDETALIDHMVASGDLVRDAAGIRLGEEWLERAASGQIHSNIEDGGGHSIIDESSGESIAHGVVYRSGKGFQIGGQLLQARRWDEQKIEVRRVTEGHLAEGEWGYTTRGWAVGAGQPQAVREYFGFAADEWPLLPLDDRTCVFHFGGTRRQVALRLIAERAGQTVRVDPWCLSLPPGVASRPAWLGEATPALVEMRLVDRIAELEGALRRPKANRHLPDAIRLEEIQRCLNLDYEVSQIATARWVRVSDPETARALRALRAAVARS